MKSNFYKILTAAVKGVAVENISRVCYAPDCKSVVKRGDKSRVIESGFLVLATMPKGKTLLADAVKDEETIAALKPFFKPKNKNRAIIATYVLQTAWGLPEVITAEKAAEADETVSVLEEGIKEYERKFKDDAEFRAAEVKKMVDSENNRHDKRIAKLNAM